MGRRLHTNTNRKRHSRPGRACASFTAPGVAASSTGEHSAWWVVLTSCCVRVHVLLLCSWSACRGPAAQGATSRQLPQQGSWPCHLLTRLRRRAKQASRLTLQLQRHCRCLMTPNPATSSSSSRRRSRRRLVMQQQQLERGPSPPPGRRLPRASCPACLSLRRCVLSHATSWAACSTRTLAGEGACFGNTLTWPAALWLCGAQAALACVQCRRGEFCGPGCIVQPTCCACVSTSICCCRH